MSAALAEASGADRWRRKVVDPGSLLALAKAAAPINDICGGDTGVGIDESGDGDGIGDGGVGVGKDSLTEGASDVGGLPGAGVRKVSRLNSQSIGGL